MRVESLAVQGARAGGKTRKPSEKCANLVTKLARYFNIFRFSAAAAAAVAFFTLSPRLFRRFFRSGLSIFLQGLGGTNHSQLEIMIDEVLRAAVAL